MSKQILTAEHAAELAVRIQAAGPFETAKMRSAREDRNSARVDGGREEEPAIPPAAWGLAAFAEGAVKKAGARWAAANPQLVWDDLLQVGRMGAAAAALTFNPSKGAFVAYAKNDINGAIRSYASEMHENVCIPADLVSSTQRGSDAQKAAAGAWSNTASLDTDDAESVPLRERIGAPEPTLSIEEKQAIRATVKTLSQVSQRVLALVIDADMTSAAAAKVLLTSEQAVRANLKRALAALAPLLKELLG
ncbi:hypothetical protein QN345_03470 [Cryobacterium sp. 10I1]|uniref:hypothetical protein n=1 Tax=Cryobacterium sp. 10I1 TaxID=3048578 RepID=UPI002B22AA36|nr:hypothetical protein [Cryobacterium sp. 10I1]MEB0304391.1 hypothetical protein [Cryobacterium sp. 10I1]